MNSGGREELTGIFASNPQCFVAARQAGARDDHRPYTGSKRAFNDFLSIRLERAVRQIHPHINDVVRLLHYS